MEIDVIFYDLPNGREPAREFLDSLDDKMRAKMVREISLLRRMGLIYVSQIPRTLAMVSLN